MVCIKIVSVTNFLKKQEMQDYACFVPFPEENPEVSIRQAEELSLSRAQSENLRNF
jgi:hypothetical protein